MNRWKRVGPNRLRSRRPGADSLPVERRRYERSQKDEGGLVRTPSFLLLILGSEFLSREFTG